VKYTSRIIRTHRVPRPEATLAGGVRRPQVIGPQKSFGFGDRLGLATPGHVAALSRQPGFMPIFAQQSLREMARTGRTPQDVMTAAVDALAKVHYRQAWGADADHLKTLPDVERAAAAGFTYFTIAPADYINDDAAFLSADGLSDVLGGMIADGDVPGEWARSYLDAPIDVPGGPRLQFEPETLQRIVVKFGRALAHCERMAAVVARVCQGREYEIELAVDEAATPTTPLEHLYLGLELEARRVRIVSLAPRLIEGFEPGADFLGDRVAFEAFLRDHAAVAGFCGPYKLSIHGGSDKLGIYPIIGRCCGDLLHVKTSGASYLEAMRVVARANPGLFEQIARYCHSRFEIDRASYRILTTTREALALTNTVPEDMESAYLDSRAGRQLLHVTYGSVLTAGRDEKGRHFKDAILETLDRNADLYTELLAAYFAEHLRALIAG
jgi:hypothetical protein